MSFDTTFDRLMGNEGGYSNDPRDPGGETNWGISKRSYPNEDIKGMTKERAKIIFRRDFWEPVQGDNLPDALAFQVADFAYNSGAQTAIRYLQRAVGVADDGHWGPVSQAAIKKFELHEILMRFIAERLRFWAKLSTWDTYGRGWANRAAKDLDYAADDT